MRRTADEKRVIDVRFKTLKPGTEVELPASDVARLRKSGHLVTPGEKDLPVTRGVQF